MNPDIESAEFVVEQGQEIGRDGRVHVRAVRQAQDFDIFITGTSVYVNEFEIEYE
jgi:predicted PhzF superfamily epimerase YddE/YHI9